MFDAMAGGNAFAAKCLTQPGPRGPEGLRLEFPLICPPYRRAVDCDAMVLPHILLHLLLLPIVGWTHPICQLSGHTGGGTFVGTMR